MPGKAKDEIFFYLSTARFEIGHFERLLPFIGCSILRNAIIAERAVNRSFSLEKFIREFTFPTIPDTSLPQYSTIQKIWSKDTWKNLAKKKITKSQTDYKLQRIGYYDYAKDAELAMLSLKKIYNHSEYKVPTFDANSICDVMMKISHALVYREESYICPPTVVHIVRILQASSHTGDKSNSKKRFCSAPTEPECSMGYFGYLMSMLEQLGYINRFKKTYCTYINFDKHKCDKKVKKYNDRYTDSIYQMHKLELEKSKIITQPTHNVILHFSRSRKSHQRSKSNMSKTKTKSKTKKSKTKRSKTKKSKTKKSKTKRFKTKKSKTKRSKTKKSKTKSKTKRSKKKTKSKRKSTR
jgi:hypothetical protein